MHDIESKVVRKAHEHLYSEMEASLDKISEELEHTEHCEEHKKGSHKPHPKKIKGITSTALNRDWRRYL